MSIDYHSGSAASQGFASCHSCGRTQTLPENGRCLRCSSPLHYRKPNSIQKTMALLVTAIILYFPANIWPIMYTVELGEENPNTIVGGIITLWDHGSFAIALIILVASVLVPIAKMLMLAYLCWATVSKRQKGRLERSKLYRMTEFVGRWSMVDVFVVAVLVALVQFGSLMAVEPGPAVLAFAGVVVMTMFAAMSFDPRLIWDASDPANASSE